MNIQETELGNDKLPLLDTAGSKIKKTPRSIAADGPESPRARAYLTGMFVLCYFSWVAVHAQREFWAMTKKTIKEDVPGIKTSFFGTIDTGLFLTYALAQFGTGMIGDHVNKRWVLAISYAIQAVLFGFMGLAGLGAYNDYHNNGD